MTQRALGGDDDARGTKRRKPLRGAVAKPKLSGMTTPSLTPTSSPLTTPKLNNTSDSAGTGATDSDSGTAPSTANGAPGFERVDQRLPASPMPHQVPQRTLMQSIRSRTRNAIERLITPAARVLNMECAPGCTKTRSENKGSRRAPDSRESSPHRSRGASESGVTSTSGSDQVVPVGVRCACETPIWHEGGVPAYNMLRDAAELASCIATLFSRFVDPVAHTVDYTALLESDDFVRYLASARKLRYFNPSMLSAAERKAFFLNIYNALMIHAMAVLRRPRTSYDRVALYGSAAYNIGGRVYTLDDVEHGVLRCNRPGGGPIARVSFMPDDARLACALPEPVDPRIHFALNCGARSCPPVRYYAPDAVDAALDTAARAFLLDVEVDERSHTIRLSRILSWYGKDFGPNANEVLRWMLPYLDDERKHGIMRLLQSQHTAPLNVVYTNYDWSVNDRKH